MMCDVGVQCNLLHIPMTSTPKKGVIALVAEDEDTFELTKEEESETAYRIHHKLGVHYIRK